VNIERAVASDAESIYELLSACGLEMSAHGFHNWNPPPIGVEGIRDTATQGELFKVIDRDVIVATVTLLEDGTVKRLAVHPDHQSMGFGAEITQWIEGYARDAGLSELQLDALAANQGLIRFYERQGYERRYEYERAPWRFVRMTKLL